MGFKPPRYWQSGLVIGSILLFLQGVSAQEISPANEQEFVDAQSVVEAAQKAGAEQYSGEPFKKAQDLLVLAGEARNKKDAVKFSQASRLARAYAELAKGAAELKTEEERLSRTREELQRVKTEIDRLKQGRAP